MMEFFKKLFGKTKKGSLYDLPPIYGGNGTSVEQAAVINCAASTTAQRLIDRFISKRHGRIGIDWKREAEFFVKDPKYSEFTIRAIGIKIKSGETLTYFFDLTRSSRVINSLIKQMNIPDDFKS